MKFINKMNKYFLLFHKLMNNNIIRINKNERKLYPYLIIIIVILVNIAGNSLKFRLDLTRNNAYVLSDHSIDVVKNLREKFSIKVLFSNDLPAQQDAVRRYLVDLLDEYNFRSNKYFSYEVIRDSDLEREASNYGIQPVQIQEFSNDQVNMRKAYMGIVLQQADIVEKIESITDVEGMEYSITSKIEKMTNKIDGLLKLEKPVVITLYMDSSMKDLEIEGLEKLDEALKTAVKKINPSNFDKLTYRLIDKSSDKDVIASAEKFGLQKIKWDGGNLSGKVIKAGEASFGIVLEIPGKHQIIPLSVSQGLFGGYSIVGTDKIEDRINKAVGTLVSSDPVIGYSIGHDEVDVDDQQSREGGAVFKKILADMYEIRTVDLTKETIPDDLSLLIINGPKREFKEHELYRIDQFLLRGKSVIFFVDSFQELQNGNPYAQSAAIPVKTGLEAFFDNVGISVNRDIVLDEYCAKANMGNVIKDYYIAPIIRKKGLSEESVITKKLQGLAVIKTSSISINDKKSDKLKYIKLVQTSDASWNMTENINLNPLFISPENAKNRQPYTIAVQVSGKFSSLFKGKKIPDDPGKIKDNGGISSASHYDHTIQKGISKVIVVGTSEITRSGFLLQSRQILSAFNGGAGRQNSEIFSNGNFLHSMVDSLAGNESIPEMRDKGIEYNPLKKIGEGPRFAVKALNIAGLPILTIIAGLMIWRLKERRRLLIADRYSRGKSND
jgi:ABC-type uncharacterized transport system involved in gliding motility auxiliary subunit